MFLRHTGEDTACRTMVSTLSFPSAEVATCTDLSPTAFTIHTGIDLMAPLVHAVGAVLAFVFWSVGIPFFSSDAPMCKAGLRCARRCPEGSVC